MKFEWDEEKAATNKAKHGISFEEACTVFSDPLFIDFYDPDHSEDEHRYILVGETQKTGVCYRCPTRNERTVFA